MAFSILQPKPFSCPPPKPRSFTSAHGRRCRPEHEDVHVAPKGLTRENGGNPKGWTRGNVATAKAEPVGMVATREAELDWT